MLPAIRAFDHRPLHRKVLSEGALDFREELRSRHIAAATPQDRGSYPGENAVSVPFECSLVGLAGGDGKVAQGAGQR